MSLKRVSYLLVRNFKPKDKKYDVSLGDGLYVTVRENGRKIFYLRYTTPKGQRSKKALGEYPSLTLADARKQAQDAKNTVKTIVNLHSVEQKKIKDDAKTIEKLTKSNFLVLISSYIQNQLDFIIVKKAY